MDTEGLREQIAVDILGYHVGTPLDSYGTAKRPQPTWCNEENCKKYKEDCEYCITDQIISRFIKELEGIESAYRAEHPNAEYSQAGILLLTGVSEAIQAMIKKLRGNEEVSNNIC